MSKAFSITYQSVRVTHRSPLQSFARPQPPTQSLRIERGFVYLGRTYSLEQKALLWYGLGGEQPTPQTPPSSFDPPTECRAGAQKRSGSDVIIFIQPDAGN